MCNIYVSLSLKDLLFNTLTLFEKDNIQIMIDEYKYEYEDIFTRLNFKYIFNRFKLVKKLYINCYYNMIK